MYWKQLTGGRLFSPHSLLPYNFVYNERNQNSKDDDSIECCFVINESRFNEVLIIALKMELPRSLIRISSVATQFHLMKCRNASESEILLSLLDEIQGNSL